MPYKVKVTKPTDDVATKTGEMPVNNVADIVGSAPVNNVAETVGSMPVNNVSALTGAKPTNTVGDYTAGTYTSNYADQIAAAQNDVLNWNYNPLQDASYQALAKVYNARGNQAAKNSVGDAAALNGGYASSYAVTAAQQARNQYNQELASYIPELESNAYNKATTKLSTLRAADESDYSRFRDTENDKYNQYQTQYQKYRDSVSDWENDYSRNYNAYRDSVSDYNTKYNNAYQAYRDAVSDYNTNRDYYYGQYRDSVSDYYTNYANNYQAYRDAMSDFQWGKDYNLNVDQYRLSKKANSSGSKNSGKSSGGKTTTDGLSKDAYEKAQKIINIQDQMANGTLKVSTPSKYAKAGTTKGTALRKNAKSNK